MRSTSLTGEFRQRCKGPLEFLVRLFVNRCIFDVVREYEDEHDEDHERKVDVLVGGHLSDEFNCSVDSNNEIRRCEEGYMHREHGVRIIEPISKNLEDPVRLQLLLRSQFFSFPAAKDMLRGWPVSFTTISATC